MTAFSRISKAFPAKNAENRAAILRIGPEPYQGSSAGHLGRQRSVQLGYRRSNAFATDRSAVAFAEATIRVLEETVTAEQAVL